MSKFKCLLNVEYQNNVEGEPRFVRKSLRSKRNDKIIRFKWIAKTR